MQPPILKTDRFRMPTVSPICQYRDETMAEKGTLSPNMALIQLVKYCNLPRIYGSLWIIMDHFPYSKG